MKSMLAFFALLVVAMAQPLSAHTKAAASTPADGSTVAAPTELRLEFPAEVRLMGVMLQNEAGDEIRIAAVPGEAARVFTIAIEESLPPGRYLASWRSVGDDSHVVSGEIRFTVSG